MARISGPLFSMDASGQVGKTLIFSRWKGIKYAKAYAVPANPRTPGQIAVRNKVRELAALWRAHPDPVARLLSGQGDFWTYLCEFDGLPMTGYNLWIRTYFPVPSDTRNIIYNANMVLYIDDETQVSLAVVTEKPNTTLHLVSEETGAEETITTNEHAYGDAMFPTEEFPVHTRFQVWTEDCPSVILRPYVFHWDGSWR